MGQSRNRVIAFSLSRRTWAGMSHRRGDGIRPFRGFGRFYFHSLLPPSFPQR